MRWELPAATPQPPKERAEDRIRDTLATGGFPCWHLDTLRLAGRVARVVTSGVLAPQPSTAELAMDVRAPCCPDAPVGWERHRRDGSSCPRCLMTTEPPGKGRGSCPQTHRCPGLPGAAPCPPQPGLSGYKHPSPRLPSPEWPPDHVPPNYYFVQLFTAEGQKIRGREKKS